MDNKIMNSKKMIKQNFVGRLDAKKTTSLAKKYQCDSIDMDKKEIHDFITNVMDKKSVGFIAVTSQFNIILLILMVIIGGFLSGCGSCQDAEELYTEEKIVEINANDKKYDSLKPQTYWTNSDVFISKQNNANEEMKFEVMSNNVNLCNVGSKTVQINGFANSNILLNKPFIDAGLKVNEGEYLIFSPYKESILIKDCNNPPQDVYVHDVQKCKNGYTKVENGQSIFVEPFEGRVIEIERYIVNQDKMLNIIASANAKILPGKKMIIPYEYEDNGVYSAFPPIPKAHESQLENVIAKPEDLAKNYWCHRTPFIPSDKISGYELNRFCDNFFVLDNIEYQNGQPKKNGQLLSCDEMLKKPLSQRPNGNTSLVATGSKLFGEINNYCFNSYDYVDFESGSATNQSVVVLNSYSQHLYGLDVYIDQVNLNQKNYSCNSTAVFSRCDAAGKSQIPLGVQIMAPNSGQVFFNSQYAIASKQSGRYMINVSRYCPPRYLYAYFSEKGEVPDFFPIDNSVSNPNVQKIDLFESDSAGNLVKKDQISIDVNKIPRSGYVFFALASSNMDYENYNGKIILSTRVTKDKKDNFFTSILNDVIRIVGEIVSQPSQIIYNNIISSKTFQQIMNVFLLLFISSYALMIVMGLNQFNAKDLSLTALKIGLVYMLLSPKSWEFFNSFLFKIFSEGPSNFLTLILTPVDQKIDFQRKDLFILFGPIGDMLSRITDITLYKQIISLIFAGPAGWIVFLLVFMSIIWLIYANFTALLIYLISVVLVSFFISVAPLFIIALMFKYTSKIFRAWLKILISNGLTLVFTFVGMYMLGSMISLLIDDLFSYGICTRCALVYKVFDLFDFCAFYAAMPDSFPDGKSFEELRNISQLDQKSDMFYGLPLPFNKIIALFILSFIARKIVDLFSHLANEVSDIGFGGPGGLGGKGGLVDKVGQNFSYWFGGQKDQLKDLQQQGVDLVIDDEEELKKGVNRKTGLSVDPDQKRIKKVRRK